MFNKNKLSVFSVIVCSAIFSISAVQTSTKHQEVFSVNINNQSINTDEDEFIQEIDTSIDTEELEKAKKEVFDEGKIEETESNILTEKIAMFPEYIFEETEDTYYLLNDTVMKKTPYDDGEDIKTILKYDEITITGKNNLKYWEITEDGNKYYIDSNQLTSNKEYIFDSTEKIKYASGNINIKEKPFEDSENIMSLNLNDEILLIGTNDMQYWKVSVNGTEGYVDKDNLMDNKKNALIKEDGIYTIHNQQELELIYAIVMQEAGNNYEGALAVISSAANRCNSSRWSYMGDTIYKQLTAPGQYCYSIDNYWVKYLNGNVTENVKRAVADGLNGVTNHNFTCFRSTSGGDSSRVNIGGNWYFGN